MHPDDQCELPISEFSKITSATAAWRHNLLPHQLSSETGQATKKISMPMNCPVGSYPHLAVTTCHSSEFEVISDTQSFEAASKSALSSSEKEESAGGSTSRYNHLGPHRCPLCDYKAKTMTHLQNHLAAHTHEGFACQRCSYRTLNKYHLSDHMKIHEPRKGNMSQQQGLHSLLTCNSSSRNSLVAVMPPPPRSLQHKDPSLEFLMSFSSGSSASAGESSQASSSCTSFRTSNFEFSTAPNLSPRQQMSEAGKEHAKQMHRCSFCPYVSPLLGNLKTHLRRHTGEKPFSCTFCHYRSTTKNNLMRHKMSVHIDLMDQQSTNNISGMDNASGLVLQVNCLVYGVLQVDGPQAICDDNSSQRGVIAMVGHPSACRQLPRPAGDSRGSSPSPAPLSNFDKCLAILMPSSHASSSALLTSSKPSLLGSELRQDAQNSGSVGTDKGFIRDSVEIQSTTGVSKIVAVYRCKSCTYSCGSAENMRKHTRVHSGEKPFACPMCSYRASQRGNLKRHIRLHDPLT
ncbi:hypothetical protein HAZT_HAZT004265, partial [Hyalella azteca]